MDYERDSFIGTTNADAQSIANMHQMQQHHVEQQKLHLQTLHQQQQQQQQQQHQQHNEQHQQHLHQQMQLLGQQPHHQQQQQQQPQHQQTHQQQQQQQQHAQIPLNFHHHFQQQQQQHHQHQYMLQQQFQQHQQQLQHHHFQQYQQQQQQQQHHHHHQQQQHHQQQHQRSPESLNEQQQKPLPHQQQQQQQHLINQASHTQSDLNILRHQEVLHAPPNLYVHAQQQQQEHINPAISTKPVYTDAHVTVKPEQEASTTLQQPHNVGSISNNNNVTVTTTIPQTTTSITTPAPTATILSAAHGDLHYGTSSQFTNHININNTSSSLVYTNNIDNNKTDNSITSTSLIQPTTSLSYSSMNGIENAAAYNKFYQTYGQNHQFPLGTHYQHQLPLHQHQHQHQHQHPHQIQHQVSALEPTLTASGSKSLQAPPVNEVPLTPTPTTTTTVSNHNINNSSYMDTTTEISATTTTTTTTSARNGNNDCMSTETMKRKNDTESEDTPDIKKLLEEKKNLAINNLRKNIRDVMDETQLDTTTLAAQREESERLARVAEQQKAMREYQRQSAANRQYARTQNRVMNLLQSGKTYAKFTDSSPALTPIAVPAGGPIKAHELAPTTPLSAEADNSNSNQSQPLPMSVQDIKPKLTQNFNDIETVMDEDKSSQSTQHSTIDGEVETDTVTVADVVTIEDSSSEDDCILLSDDDDEELMDDDEEEADDPHNSGLHVQDNYNVPDELGRVVINVGHPEGEEDIFVAPQIAKTIKPHQIGGVRFLFDNIIESTKRFKNSSGFGCILAHSMGLGKTLQVVCFCDIFLRHTNSKTVLCVMPINTLQNWVNEFNMWTPRHSDDPHNIRPRHFDVFVLNDQHKTLSARAKVILRWAEEGGVLLIGYELFRLLALKIMPTRRRRGQKQLTHENTSSEAHKRLTESIYQALVKPGPDLVICDEGHRIKNSHAGISLALKQIRTRRRIVLTGYPLQNNLLEYWCMVDFVRPNYLGTRTEFCNMFERPIQNGQCIDSTPEDIKLMRYRAHVLHSLLMGFVQRRSHMVLQQTLPQKLEYVILTRMTSFQRQLYDTFMNDVVRTRTVPNPLKAFSVCCKIWNHPDVLYNFLKRYELDLDIEIEEGEIVPEIPPIVPVTPTAGTILPISKNNSTTASMNGINDSTSENGVVPAIFVDESQTSSSGFSSMNAPTPTPTPTTDVPPPPKYEHIPAAATTSTLPTSTKSSIKNDVTKAIANGNNNFWLEPNLPYYTSFPAVMPSNHGISQPDYVGLMVKPSATGAGESIHTGSSEIVDLDTKEIKTVETDIDMEPKVDVKSESETTTKISENKITEILKPSEDNNPDDDNDDAANVKKQNINSPPLTIVDTKMLEKESKWADGVPYDWALDLMKKYEPDLIENSPKMEVFFCILHQSIELEDRVLLFSQSLLTLNLIERFLQANFVPGTTSYWARNISYFRLDGSTNSQEREKLVTEFNSNHDVKLFLISTRAGSLGINLVGANRVVVFDASWNPCHDTQAVYRIYRYGQQKACYVYRIVMDRCLEKKIYDRQIKKQGMSDRVVDECNPDAHLSLKDVTNLCHDYDDNNKSPTDEENFKTPVNNYLDGVVKTIITDYKSRLSKEPFYHESLLIDRKEKKLSQAEKRQAHRGYEMEKKASIKQTVAYAANNKVQYRLVRNDGVTVARPLTAIRPITNTKVQQNSATRNTGVRSTRWIPAEVWQRQGMTAQEMTLPLDVVIPTNSSDKSNIILKAGQRVMVLKSAKGIYMQLDSGKIIAIRTSSKAADTSNNHNNSSSNSSNINVPNKVVAVNKSNEVIDITADGDNASNQTSTSCTSSISNSSSNTSKNHNQHQNHINSVTTAKTMCDITKSQNYNKVNNPNLNSTIASNSGKFNVEHTTKEIPSTRNILKFNRADTNMNNINNNGLFVALPYEAKDANKQQSSLLKSKMEYNTFSQLTQQQHNSQSLNTTSTGPTSVNRTKTSQKIEITSNESLPPLKPFLSIMPTTSANTTTNNTTSTATINNYNTIITNPLLMQKSSHNMNHIHDNKMNQKVFEKDQHKSHQHHQQHHLNNINNNHDNSQNKKSLLNSETKTLLTVQQQKQKMHQQNAAFGHHQGISMPPSPSSTSSPLPLPFTKQSNKSINNCSNSQSTATSSSSSTSFAEFSHNANHVEPKEAPYGHKVASPTHDNVNSFPNTFDSATMTTNQRLTTVVTPKNNSKNLETECFQNPNTFQHNTKDSTDNVLKTSLTETKASSSSSAPTTTTTSISSNLAPQSSAPSSVSMASTTTVTSGHHLMDGTESYNKLSTDTLPSYLQYGNHQKATQQQQQQQQQFAQQQQSAKLRLYMPQYGMPQAHPHAHYYGSAMPQGPGGPPVVKNIPNYSPYYESMYDCGNGLPGAVDYVSAAAASVPVTHQASVPSTAPTPLPPALPTSSASSAVAAAAAAAYADYPAYTHHAPYHTNFPANNYGCSPLTTAVRGSPYMHWSPLVTSASLVDHHAAPNSMFTSANYANDAAAAAAVTQTSQWNQL